MLRPLLFALMLGAALLPLWRDEVYPFSSYPMFSDNTGGRMVFSVTTPDGAPLDELDYGLFDRTLNVRGVRFAYRPKPYYADRYDSIDADHVRTFLYRYHRDAIYPILVRAMHRGLDEDRRRVVTLRHQTFRVDAPKETLR